MMNRRQHLRVEFRSAAIRLMAVTALLLGLPLLFAGNHQLGRPFTALADDDGPGGAAPGSSDGGTGSGAGGRTGNASFNNTALNFWQTNKARRTLWGQRKARRQAPRRVQLARTRAPVVVPAPVYAQPAVQREFVAWAVNSDSVTAIERAGFQVVARGALSIADGEALRVRAPAGLGRQTALRRLGAAAPGAVIAENNIYRNISRPSGTRRGETGRTIEHTVACSAGSTVAIIDTALDRDHPAFAGSSLVGLTVRAPDRQPSSTGHGTAVASMLIGRRDGPAPGLAPGARLVAVDAFHKAAGGDATDAFDLVRAIDLVSTQDAKVINMSLTGPENAVVGAAVSAIQKRGAIVVAAAGNDGPRARPLYPAAYPGVIAVAAVDGEGEPWRRSARGDHIAFSAEGVGIALAGRAGGVEPHTGTSFAAPVVTAMLAGKLQRLQTANAEVLTSHLASIARDSGEPGRDPVFGFGIVRPQDGCR
jgi:Subtilase family